MHCNLQVVDLRAGEMDYEVLSYGWGPHDEYRGTWVNKVAWRVTTNLYRALRRLRYKDRTRNLWADAIAISQLDIKERSHQIERMTNIYQDAKRVLMWIGESAGGSGK